MLRSLIFSSRDLANHRGVRGRESIDALDNGGEMVSGGSENRTCLVLKLFSEPVTKVNQVAGLASLARGFPSDCIVEELFGSTSFLISLLVNLILKQPTDFISRTTRNVLVMGFEASRRAEA